MNDTAAAAQAQVAQAAPSPSATVARTVPAASAIVDDVAASAADVAAAPVRAVTGAVDPVAATAAPIERVGAVTNAATPSAEMPAADRRAGASTSPTATKSARRQFEPAPVPSDGAAIAATPTQAPQHAAAAALEGAAARPQARAGGLSRPLLAPTRVVEPRRLVDFLGSAVTGTRAPAPWVPAAVVAAARSQPSQRLLADEPHRAAAPARLPFETPTSTVVGGVASGAAGAALLFFLCLCTFLWVAPPLRRWLRLQLGSRMLPAFVAPLEQPG